MARKPTAKETLQKAEQTEVKMLANQIFRARELEIKRTEDWKAKWLM